MDVQPFKILLVLSDVSLLVYLGVLIYQHIYWHNNLKSFAFTFHILCLVWLFFRGLFWISTLTNELPWTDASYYFLYWMPVPLEFGSFLLLPLYFARVLYPDEWKEYRGLLRPIYVVIIVGLLSFQLIYIIADLVYKNEMTRGCGSHECFQIEISNNAFRGVTAACFMLLGIVVSICAVDLHSLEKQRYDRYFSCSPERMTYVNCVLVTSFFSRSLYQILAALGLYVLPDVPVSVDGDVPFMVFVFFELWDYIPTILLISTITRTVGSNTSSKRNLDINYTSRKLFSSSYSQYGSTDADGEDSEQEDAITNRTSDESAGLIPDRENVMGIDLTRIPSKRRSGSHGNRDAVLGAADVELPVDAAANSLINRYLMPHSLDRADSSLMTYDSARYWRNINNSPPGSNPGSLTGPAPALNGYMTAPPGHTGAYSTATIAPLNDTRAPVPGLYNTTYGSGNSLHAHSAGTSVQSAGSSNNGGSLLERNESIVAYYTRQRHLSITDTVGSTESCDSLSPRNGAPNRQVRGHPVSADGTRLKPCLSPKSSTTSMTSQVDSAPNPGIGISPGSALPGPLELPPRCRLSEQDNTATNTCTSELSSAQSTGGSVHSAQAIHDSPGPVEPAFLPEAANELQMEPPDRPESALTQDYYGERYDQRYHYSQQIQVHTQQLSQQGPLAQVYLTSPSPGGAMQLGISPNWYAPQLQIVVTSPTNAADAAQHSPHHQRVSPVNVLGNQGYMQPNGQYMVPSMQITHLPGNALHIQPVYVRSPALVHSQASSQHDRSDGSLSFSQTDSPSLHGANLRSDSRQSYYYEDSNLGSSTHSTATSHLSAGIGMTREEQSRDDASSTSRSGALNGVPGAPSGLPRANSGNSSPQLRTVYPRPTRPTATVRNLGGYNSPSQRPILDNQSSGSSFERGANSFSPSFIAGLDSERDTYLQQNEDHHQHQQRLQGAHMTYAALNPYSSQQRTHHTVSTPERQEAARANALIREDNRKEKC